LSQAREDRESMQPDRDPEDVSRTGLPAPAEARTNSGCEPAKWAVQVEIGPASIIMKRGIPCDPRFPAFHLRACNSSAPWRGTTTANGFCRANRFSKRK